MYVKWGNDLSTACRRIERKKIVLLTVQRVRMTTVKKERNKKTDCMAAP